MYGRTRRPAAEKHRELRSMIASLLVAFPLVSDVLQNRLSGWNLGRIEDSGSSESPTTPKDHILIEAGPYDAVLGIGRCIDPGFLYIAVLRHKVSFVTAHLPAAGYPSTPGHQPSLGSCSTAKPHTNVSLLPTPIEA